MTTLAPIDPLVFFLLAGCVGVAAGVVCLRLMVFFLDRLGEGGPEPGFTPLGACARAETFPGPLLSVFTVVVTVLVFTASAWRFGPTPIAVCTMVFGAALIVLAGIDLRVSLLPDAITLPLIWLGLLVNLAGVIVPLEQAVLGAVFGYGFLWLLFHAFRLLTGRDGMGYGDFKLLAAMGAWLGIAALPALLLVASLAGVVIGMLLRSVGRTQRGQALPFGPYLVVAGLLTLYFPGLRLW